MADYSVIHNTKAQRLLYILGSKIETPEQAFKAKRRAILSLLALVALQVSLGLFMWWTTTIGIPVGNESSPIYSGLLFFVLAILLYFFNSRIAAGLLILIAIGDIGIVVSRFLSSGTGGGGIALLQAIVALDVAVTFFKLNAWSREGIRQLPRSKVTVAATGATLVLIIAGIFIQPVHFLWYLETQTAQSTNDNAVIYQDLTDKYSFVFPGEWETEHTPYRYGYVHLNPAGTKDVVVEIERWAPWDVPAVSLINKNVFLEFANSEATAYSKKNNATIELVEMTRLANLDVPRAIYLDADGTKKYVYYIYNRGWTRQTSDGAFYFWRITAKVPKAFQQYEKEVESIASSFKVNQNIVR